MVQCGFTVWTMAADYANIIIEIIILLPVHANQLSLLRLWGAAARVQNFYAKL